MNNIAEISDNVTKLSSAWEHFKSINDQRLRALEKKGTSDPLLDDQLRKVGESLDHHKERLARLETTLARPEIMGQTADYQYDEHKSAFSEYLRQGIERKSLSAASDRDGGYLVTAQMSKNIVKAMVEISPMRQLAAVETISTDSLDVLEDITSAAAGWVAETAARNDTDTPQLGKKKIHVHELYAQPKATQKLIDDASVNIEQWLSGKLVEIFTMRENDAFINGDGAGKPRGILSYKAGKNWGEIEQISSGTKGAISADSIFALYFSLKEAHAARSSFIMHRSVVQELRKIKEETTGRYLWNPGLAAESHSTLLGVPVLQVQEMPALASGNIAMALADFASGYKIVDRSGIRILRDPFTDKPFVKFYSTKRVGADVVNYEAIKLLKIL